MLETYEHLWDVEIQPQLQEVALPQFELGKGSSNSSELESSHSKWKASDPVHCEKFSSEQSCLLTIGDAEKGRVSSEGHRKEESDLTPKKPSPGRSSSQSVLHKPQAQFHPVAQPMDCGRGALFIVSPSGRQTHKQINNVLNPSKCKNCGGDFPCPWQYGVPLETLSAQNFHECQHRGQKLSQNLPCGDHNSINAGNISHSCEECGKVFLRSSCLIERRRIHTEEKPYVCKECGKAFFRSSHLIQHWRIHTGEKPYVCEECGKAFSQIGNLSYHCNIHSKEKPHKCQKCGKAFTLHSGLTRHMRKHNGEKTCL